MPLSPAAFVAHYESTDCANPSAVNKTSNAGGCYQFLPSTWRDWAPRAGIDLNAYPTADKAPVSVQTAAFNTMYQARGFKDYTCEGCDPKLSAALDRLGGPSAFAPGNTLSTSPSAYAALDTSTGFQSFFGSQGAFSDPLGGSAAISGGVSASADPGYDVAQTPGSLAQTFSEPDAFRPFSFVYNQYKSVVVQPLTTDIGLVTQQVQGIYPTLALIAIASAGIGLAYGLRNGTEFTRRAFKIAGVGAAITFLLANQSTMVDLLDSVPAWLGAGITPAGAVSGPAASFDNIAATFLSYILKTIKAGSLVSPEFYLALLLILIATPFIAACLVVMFSVWFSGQIIAHFLLILAAIMLLTLLSDITENLFYKYLHSFIALAAVAFAAVVVGQLASQIVQGVFDGLPNASGAAAIAVNLLGASFALAAIATTLTAIWWKIEAFTGSAGTSRMAMSATNNAMTRAATRAVTTVASPVAAAAANVVPFRRSTPVGPSMSRRAS